MNIHTFPFSELNTTYTVQFVLATNYLQHVLPSFATYYIPPITYYLLPTTYYLITITIIIISNNNNNNSSNNNNNIIITIAQHGNNNNSGNILQSQTRVKLNRVFGPR